jgi:hypothetical protein
VAKLAHGTASLTSSSLSRVPLTTTAEFVHSTRLWTITFSLCLASGAAHCLPGKGHYPTKFFSDLVVWDERGNTPTQLVAQDQTHVDSATGFLESGDAAARGRSLCVYPRVQRCLGGDSDVQSSFECVEE